MFGEEWATFAGPRSACPAASVAFVTSPDRTLDSAAQVTKVARQPAPTRITTPIGLAGRARAVPPLRPPAERARRESSFRPRARVHRLHEPRSAGNARPQLVLALAFSATG